MLRISQVAAAGESIAERSHFQPCYNVGLSLVNYYVALIERAVYIDLPVVQPAAIVPHRLRHSSSSLRCC